MYGSYLSYSLCDCFFGKGSLAIAAYSSATSTPMMTPSSQPNVATLRRTKITSNSALMTLCSEITSPSKSSRATCSDAALSPCLRRRSSSNLLSGLRRGTAPLTSTSRTNTSKHRIAITVIYHPLYPRRAGCRSTVFILHLV